VGIQEAGWVTERMFAIWAKWFCEWLEAYRTSLGLDPTELAIITLDNWPTHNCPEAMSIFKIHYVIFITFPPHLTHAMQSIDVG
jgi:hypothetical protein